MNHTIVNLDARGNLMTVVQPNEDNIIRCTHGLESTEVFTDELILPIDKSQTLSIRYYRYIREGCEQSSSFVGWLNRTYTLRAESINVIIEFLNSCLENLDTHNLIGILKTAQNGDIVVGRYVSGFDSFASTALVEKNNPHRFIIDSVFPVITNYCTKDVELSSISDNVLICEAPFNPGDDSKLANTKFIVESLVPRSRIIDQFLAADVYHVIMVLSILRGTIGDVTTED